MATVAEQIREWRRDIRMLGAGEAWRVSMLCWAYNWATSPTAMRTDREHRACRRFAKFCRKGLGVEVGWFESESGRFSPTRPGYVV
jgi:hypothetical protein